MNRKVKAYLAFVYTLFFTFFICLYFFQNLHIDSYLDIFFFVSALMLSSNISAIGQKKKGILTSINLPLILPAMVLLNPFWTAVTAMIGTIKLYQITKNFKWYQFLFNRFVFFIAAGSGALAFNMSNYYFDPTSYHIIAFFAGALVYFLINNGMVFLVIKFAYDGKKDTSLLLHYIQLSKTLITSYFLGLIFYISYITVGKVFFILVIVLIYILKDLLFSRIQQIDSFTQIVESFLKVIDSKDHYTQGHCERVARYTKTFCQDLGLSRSRTERIVNMAKIHDIGKINVEDEILKSSAFLTREESVEMKKHSQYGYELLEDIDLLRRDLKIILYHHERYDGNGYPEGKKGQEIPLGARILNICDSFDVMVTGREYKPPKDKNEIIREFEDCAGKQFDPELSSRMIKLINNNVFGNIYSNVS